MIRKKPLDSAAFFWVKQACSLLLRVVALGRAGVQLARTADAVGTADHFVPVREPADGAGHCEDHGKHGSRNTDGLQNDAGVEVDVRVQLALNEVFVFQGNLFQALGNLQQRIVFQAKLAQHFVGGLCHYLGARVEVLVNPVTKAHQAERIVFVLGLGDEFLDVGLVADFSQHVQNRFVRTAVRRAPKGGDAGGDTRVRVGAGGARQAYGGGRGVLLVVSVKDKDLVHRVGQNRVRLVVLARGAEHHVQEVLGVGQVVTRIHERLAHGVLVAPCRDGRHLGDQAMAGNLALLRISHIHLVVVERRQCTHNAAHNGHGVRITAEAVEEVAHLVVQHGVVFDGVVELLVLFSARQFTVQEQVADLEEVGMLGQLVDWVTPVQQDAFGTIDIGDGRFAGCGRYKTRVVSEYAFLDEAAYVYNVRADGAGVNRYLNGLVAHRERGFPVGHGALPFD